MSWNYGNDNNNQDISTRPTFVPTWRNRAQRERGEGDKISICMLSKEAIKATLLKQNIYERHPKSQFKFTLPH